MSGKINLTVGQIQGNLRQIMETFDTLTPEQRYSLKSAIETMSFLHRMSPGLQKVVSEMQTKMPSNGHANGQVHSSVKIG